MSTRASGFARVEHEHYPTPAWVIDALAEHIPLKGRAIWEPACGTGQMSEALIAAGAAVSSTDIHDHGYTRLHCTQDFLKGGNSCAFTHYEGIITNPPYGRQNRTAEAFIRQGLRMIADYGFLALLLPVDFDSAKTRAEFFRDCPLFTAKIVLTRRIKWFEPPEGEKSSGPSQNHTWFVWQRTWVGERQIPRTLYAPTETQVAA